MLYPSLKDLEFLTENKVTHAINCAAEQIENIDEAVGVKCISFSWNDDTQVL